MSPPIRLYSLLGELPRLFVQRQFIGSPPEQTEGAEPRTELPRPNVLLIIEEAPSSFFLYRYTRDGYFAGDTWHQRLEDAKHQADMEYAEAVGSWRACPVDVTDVVDFVVQQARL